MRIIYIIIYIYYIYNIPRTSTSWEKLGFGWKTWFLSLSAAKTRLRHQKAVLTKSHVSNWIKLDIQPEVFCDSQLLGYGCTGCIVFRGVGNLIRRMCLTQNSWKVEDMQKKQQAVFHLGVRKRCDKSGSNTWNILKRSDISFQDSSRSPSDVISREVVVTSLQFSQIIISACLRFRMSW